MEKSVREYSVAGCRFEVAVPLAQDLGRLLPNFRDFVSDGGGSLFLLDATATKPIAPDGETLLSTSDSDAGKLRLGAASGDYILRLSFGASDFEHSVRFSVSQLSGGDGEGVEAHIDWRDPLAGQALNSMLRILFSQALLLQGGVSLHSSAVVAGGKAYLFLGPSGTGKSTHSRLWGRVFADCFLLNDDNPAVRVSQGEALAYGTPWSGKTPCHRNAGAPLGGLVRLVQARRNRFGLQEDTDAFATLLPSGSAIRQDPELLSALCDNLAELAGSVPVGVLECLPDEAAARLCRESLEDASRS